MEKTIDVAVAEAPPSPQAKPASEGFFHWIQDEEAKSKSIKHATSIPWTGLAALLLAFITTMLSFVLLTCVDKKPTWPTTGIGKVTQPASWLSALISANSIALHIALTEGVTIAWWFRATRPSATIKDLHKVWLTGTSAKSAALNLKGLSYVSLATLFVAIIPINGVLLQGALETNIALHSFQEQVFVPMVQRLPLGFSSMKNTFGTWAPYTGTRWPFIFQQVTNTVGNNYAQYAYFGNTDWYDQSNRTLNELLYKNETQSIWFATVPGAGFEMKCNSSTRDYNLTITDVNYSRLLAQTTFRWSNSTPNVMSFNTVWKPDYDCEGQYQVRNCTLTAAVVEYPVQVQLNVSSAVVGPYYSLQENTTYLDDTVMEIIEPYPDEGVYNSTYFGLYLSFANWFGGNITLENYYKNSTVSSATKRAGGGFMDSLVLDYGPYTKVDACDIGLKYGLMNMNYSESFNSEQTQGDAEHGWWYATEDGVDVADVILGQIRQAAFLSAVYSGSSVYSVNYVPEQWIQYDNDSNIIDWYLPHFEQSNASDFYVQSANSTRFMYAPTYQFRRYMWGASIALTYSIILVILPTFYGFWTLVRKPTMSPVDMARAFNAPVVTSESAHQQMKVDALLKEVGQTPIHQLPKSRTGLSEARTLQDDGRRSTS